MRGVGIDIVEIARIRAAVERHGDGFLRRIYTPGELDGCRTASGGWRFASLAARFAAKEAFYKAAFPALRRFIGWQECEVVNDADGVPQLRLAEKLAEELGGTAVQVSLSHSRNHAIAIVVIE